MSDQPIKVGDVFGLADISNVPPPVRYVPQPGETAAAYLRRTGWEQAFFPDRHRISGEKVWTHPRLTSTTGPVTFGHALLLAGFRRKSHRPG